MVWEGNSNIFIDFLAIWYIENILPLCQIKKWTSSWWYFNLPPVHKYIWIKLVWYESEIQLECTVLDQGI